MPRGVYPRTKVKVRPTDRPTDRVVSVSAINWPAMLASLEQQRAALDDERADIDAVIETVRRRAGPQVTIAAIQQTQRAHGGNGKRLTRAATTSKVTGAQWQQARHWWDDGMAGDEIGRRLGVTGVSIREHARRHDWPARKRKYASPPVAAAAPKPAEKPAPRAKPGNAAAPATGEQLSGSVRCPHCSTWTDYDPCRSCGKPVRKYAK